AVRAGGAGIAGPSPAAAFRGSGFKIAPAVGQCMAELITEGRARTVDIAAFGLGRFARGERIEGPHPYATRPDHEEPVAAGGRRAATGQRAGRTPSPGPLPPPGGG